MVTEQQRNYPVSVWYHAERKDVYIKISSGRIWIGGEGDNENTSV